jgi:hypothetical protein|tara:strand:+ start:839 stop:1030 length:192 start_codon:yes stop_codon:yes gene_type:complete
MIHSLEQLINKINAMHDMAVLAHRKRYQNHDGSYDHATLKHDIEQIQAMAGEIYHDKEGDEIK